MGTEDIEIKEQWDAVTTANELDKLKDHVKDFMSHTAQTMLEPSYGPFGEPLPDEYRHPMSRFFGVIESCKEATLLRYGKDMYKQAQLFDVHFTDEVED